LCLINAGFTGAGCLGGIRVEPSVFTRIGDMRLSYVKPCRLARVFVGLRVGVEAAEDGAADASFEVAQSFGRGVGAFGSSGGPANSLDCAEHV